MSEEGSASLRGGLVVNPHGYLTLPGEREKNLKKYYSISFPSQQPTGEKPKSHKMSGGGVLTFWRNRGCSGGGLTV